MIWLYRQRKQWRRRRDWLTLIHRKQRKRKRKEMCYLKKVGLWDFFWKSVVCKRISLSTNDIYYFKQKELYVDLTSRYYVTIKWYNSFESLLFLEFYLVILTWLWGMQCANTLQLTPLPKTSFESIAPFCLHSKARVSTNCTSHSSSQA